MTEHEVGETGMVGDVHLDEFAPLSFRRPLVDQLTDRVLAHIRTKRLQPGARLPATAEMARSFGVAPTTLREALRRLQATGVIDVRHGVGIFVKSDASRLMVVNPDRLEADKGRLKDLVDARRLIEPTLAGRAAERRSDADVAELEQLLASSAALRADRAQAGEANLRFHRRIAQIAGNSVVSDMLAALLDLHVGDQLIIDRLFADPARDHAEHVNIAKAIAAGDARAARRRMQLHLDEVMTSVRTGEAEPP